MAGSGRLGIYVDDVYRVAGGTEPRISVDRAFLIFACEVGASFDVASPAEIDLSISLFGRKLALPVLIAPTGLSGLYWPDGEFAVARAAAAAGTAFVLSHASVPTMEEVAATGISPRWQQVFIYKDRGLTLEFANRAAAAGYDALVLSSVERSGDAINRNVNPALTKFIQTQQPSTVLQPNFGFRADGWWAQGLTAGLAVTF